jgi:ABC-2 type transport system permease protein
MVRLVVRRNRVRLAAWWAYVVVMLAYVAAYYRESLPTQRALDDFAAVSATPGMRALTGVAAEPATLGGAVWTKIWMTLALGLAFGMVFLVTRNGRADEEEGRCELLRSRVLGIHAGSAATWTVMAALCALAGAGAALVCLQQGLDPQGAGHSGSWLFGLSVAGVGLVAIGVSALAGQVASTSRGANGLASAVIGVFYALRMAGDLGNGALTWASPIGWGQEARPWGQERWWPLLLQCGLALILLGAAAVLEEHRDHGAGLLPDRPGPSGAPARWASPPGLALRLERGAILGWTAAIAATAVILGSVTQPMENLVADASPEVAARLGGEGMGALVAMLVRIVALVVLAFALQATLPLRGDEASGILEAQLSRGLSRTRWALGRLAVPVLGAGALLALAGACMGAAYGAVVGDAGQIRLLAGAALAYWPATMTLVGAAVAVFGWFPRAATATTWTLLAAVWVVEMAGVTTGLPRWVLDATPFHATPPLPSEPMAWTPLAAMTVLAVALAALGVGRLARRDLDAG